MQKSLGVVVLASGEGVRFGGGKLLAPFHGKPLLAYTLLALSPELFSKRVVVTRGAEIAVLAVAHGFHALLHPYAQLCDTIRLGTSWMQGVDGCLFCVGDQPLINPKTLRRMVEAFDANPNQMIRAAAGERMGNPVLFPAALFEELCALQGEESGSAVIRAHRELVLPVQVEAERELYDIDTQADYERLSFL
ncbi:MAG: nucleotidyltransferase family protein [Clostridia bacterium]